MYKIKKSIKKIIFHCDAKPNFDKIHQCVRVCVCIYISYVLFFSSFSLTTWLQLGQTQGGPKAPPPGAKKKYQVYFGFLFFYSWVPLLKNFKPRSLRYQPIQPNSTQKKLKHITHFKFITYGSIQKKKFVRSEL